MRLDAFLLADAVSAPPDGKLYIHGGGLTVIRAPVVPFSTPLGIAIRLLAEEAELERPHEFTLSIRDPEGGDVVPAMSFKTGPATEERLEEGEERFLQIAVNFGGLGFPVLGTYQIEFQADGEPVRTMALPVVAIGEPPAGTLPMALPT
jgi:hypothetical protein